MSNTEIKGVSNLSIYYPNICSCIMIRQTPNINGVYVCSICNKPLFDQRFEQVNIKIIK